MILKNAKQRSRDYFNSHNSSRLAYGGYWRHDYRYQIEAIGRIRPDRLIDIGCGPGAFLSLVETRFPEIQLSGLDLSEGMIRKAEERLSDDAILTVGDAESMPLESEQFQAVTCNMSIHHYPHPQDALNEMYRILRPGGFILLNDLDCIPAVRTAANWIFPRLPGGDVRMYSREEIREMVLSAGFRKFSYRKISPFSFQCLARKPF